MQVMVLYADATQNDFSSMVSSDPSSSTTGFSAFFSSIAKRIDLASWEAGRREFLQDSEEAEELAYHRKWRGIDVIFHLAIAPNRDHVRKYSQHDLGTFSYAALMSRCGFVT